MNLKRDYWIAILCKFAVIATEMLVTVFINRGLGVSGKGEYAYIIKIVEVLYVFCSLGLGQAYATFRKANRQDLRTLIIGLSYIQCILVLVLGITITAFFRVEYGVAITVLASLATGRCVFSMIAVIENSIKRNIIQVVLNTVYVIFLGILFAAQRLELDAAICCYGIIELVRIVLLSVIYRMKPKMHGANKETLLSVYKTGFETMIFIMLTTLNYSVTTIMIKNLHSAYSAGIFSVGANFSTIFLLIPDSFKDVLFGDSSTNSFSKRTAYTAIKVSLLFSVVAFTGWLLFGKLCIQIFYGAEYLEAYSVTSVMFVGCFFMTFYKILQPVFIAEGNQRIACIYLLVALIANITGNYMLIPRHSYNGAAFATVISYAICGSLFLIKYRDKNSVLPQ